MLWREGIRLPILFPQTASSSDARARRRQHISGLLLPSHGDRHAGTHRPELFPCHHEHVSGQGDIHRGKIPPPPLWFSEFLPPLCRMLINSVLRARHTRTRTGAGAEAHTGLPQTHQQVLHRVLRARHPRDVRLRVRALALAQDCFGGHCARSPSPGNLLMGDPGS